MTRREDLEKVAAELGLEVSGFSDEELAKAVNSAITQVVRQSSRRPWDPGAARG